MNILPNFFIVGAARSGTTSLWKYLEENDEVFMPGDELLKEPAFWSQMKDSMGIEEYLNIFRDVRNSHKRIGEASTAYLTDPESARRIYDFNPNVKIVIILRNPAERAHSLYNWMVQQGYEYAGSFEKALEMEYYRKGKKIPNFFEPEYYYNYLYFNSGLYYEQVKRYTDLFGNNVMVIRFDDFKNDVNRIYDRVCLFLNINTNRLTAGIHNEAKGVYSPHLQFLLRKINNCLVQINLKLFPKTIKTQKSRDKLLRLGLKNQRPGAIKEKTKAFLIKKYENDINLLSKLTNINFQGWIKQG